MLMPSVQLLGFMDRFCVSMSIDAGRPKSKSKSSTLCTWRKIENLMMNNRKKKKQTSSTASAQFKHHPTLGCPDWDSRNHLRRCDRSYPTPASAHQRQPPGEVVKFGSPAVAKHGQNKGTW